MPTLGAGLGSDACTALMRRHRQDVEMPYVASPPIANSGVPDGDAMARALSQAAVDAGWGNGIALSVTGGPPTSSFANYASNCASLIAQVRIR